SNSNNHLMDGFLSDILATPTNTDISIGLGTYLHTATGGGVDETLYELQKAYTAGADSATFFSWGSFFGSGALGDQRLAAVNEWYDALTPSAPGGGLSPDATLITSFDPPGDEGYFSSSITAGGQTTIDPSSAADQTSLESHLGGGSQALDIRATGSWTLRHLSGGAAPAGNLALEAEGYVGFWLMTESPGLTVQVALDDPGTADRGLLKNIIADGQWHLYEWDLEDDAQWEGWVTGDGLITGPTVTLDSIFFYGVGDALLYLDTVAHNPLGSLLAPPVTGDYNADGQVDAQDYAAWRSQYGESVTPGQGADGNIDGVVDSADYVVWRDAFAAALQPATLNGAPEPAGLWMLFFAAAVVIGQRNKKAS
ncbi:MAG: hypothetical protein KDA37_17990, partial [Planctomycetales bacterium]|nr:hypothetical protein [Planctomycetales bacterium]